MIIFSFNTFRMKTNIGYIFWKKWHTNDKKIIHYSCFIEFLKCHFIISILPVESFRHFDRRV